LKAYVIGDKDLVLGFQLVGIPGLSVSNENEALEALKKVIDTQEVKMVFISEELSILIEEELNEIRSKNNDLIIVDMPGRSEVKGELPSVQKLIRKILKIRV